MSRRIRDHLRSHAIAYLALFFALTGTAVALPGTNTVDTGDIINGQVRSPDISNTNGVRTADVLDDNLAGGGLAAVDLRPSSVGSSEIVNESITTNDLQSNSVENDEIEDGQVTSADIGTGAVGAAEIGDQIVNRPDPTPTPVPANTNANGSYIVNTSIAACNPGEELIGGTAQWVPDDNADGDLELFIGEIRLDHTDEEVTVDGGNDTNTNHDLQAVAVCLVP